MTILSQSSNANVVKPVQPNYQVKPGLKISENHNQGNFYPHTCLNGGAVQTGCLDTSSSMTSVCLSQSNTRFLQNENPLSYNPPSMFCRDNIRNMEIQADARCNVSYGNSMKGQMRMPLNLDSNVTHTTVSNSELSYKSGVPEILPAVLTCEDLGQSILSQVNENGSSSQQHLQDS